MEIPPQGVARRKTRVLGQGGAAGPAGPPESLLRGEQSLAGRGGAAAFVGFGAEPALERAEGLLPQLLHRRWEVSCACRSGTRLGEAGAELRGGAGGRGRGPEEQPEGCPHLGRQCKAQPARGPGSAATGGGTSEAQRPGVRGAGVGLRTQEVSAGRGSGSPQALLLWALEEEGAGLCIRLLTS